MLMIKDGKLIALDKNDQERIFELLKAGGTRIIYHQSYLSGLSSLMIVNAHGEEVSSLAGESISTINKLTHISDIKGGMELSEFIDNYCPLYSK